MPNPREFLKHIRANPYFYGPAAVLAALMALYAVYWTVSAGQVRKGFETWVERQNANGLQVSYADLRLSGFPYRYSIVLSDFSYGNPLHPRKWAWTADRLRLAMYVYNTGSVLADLSGRHELSYDENLTVEARAPGRIVLTGSSEKGRAKLRHKRGRIERLSLSLDNLTAERQGPGVKSPFAADRLELHGRPTPPEMERQTTPEARARDIDLFLRGTNLTLPVGDQLQPSTENIKGFQADLQLVDFEPVLVSGELLTDWADAGGAVELRTVYIESDAYDLIAQGTLSVDSQRMLAGSIDTRVGGYNALVDRLVDQSLIKKEHAQPVKSVLQVLSITNGDGTGRIKAPLEFKDGQVKIGPARIATLRPLF